MQLNRDIWKTPPTGRIQLPANTADIWLIPLERSEKAVQHLQAYLSADEQLRAQQFITQHLANRFIVRRVWLRLILSAYTGLQPDRIQYQVGTQGKLSIDGGIAFNLSHSGRYAVCVIWGGCHVGIDIEAHQADLETLSIARHYFSTAEQAELATLPEAKRIQGFYTCWTRKEAVIKADGRGLQIPLASFDVTPLHDDTVTVQPRDFDAPLYINHLPIGSQCTCAIAVEHPLADVRYWFDDALGSQR